MDTFNPFSLDLKPRWLARSLESLFSLNKLINGYELRPSTDDVAKPSDKVDEFLDYTVDLLSSGVDVRNPDALETIPDSGPLIIVANHPLGGLEGVAMTQLLRQKRPDLKVLTNELLSRIPEFAETFVGVDVLSDNAAAKNLKGVRTVMRHLSKGGALLIYPAGMVSAIEVSDGWKIQDRVWNPLVGKLAKQYQATCLPCFVHGKNSQLFYLSGLIHPRLRTALLPRELTNKKSQKLSLTVGSPILWRDISELDSIEDVTRYYRTATDLLSMAEKTEVAVSHPPLNDLSREQSKSDEMDQVIESLASYNLLDFKNFSVFCAPYSTLGPIMDEIAFARERTFRAAGEGTGADSDTDQFDPYYEHLFIWDRDGKQIVGSYRVGKAKEIVATHGVDGLYSRSLYKFDKNFIDRLGGAAEVGRSFITPEYQRHPRALDLLWQGIGRWMVKHPEYHTLFGCVSISQEHSKLARAFLEDSLMCNYRAEQEYLNDVRPVAPLKVKNRIWNQAVLQSLSTVTMINKLLGQCDPGKTIPILLRQYIALNGRFIGFSVNHGFNESLDGLIMVDLRRTSQKHLQRYLGKEGSAEFMSRWGVTEDVA